MVEPQRDEVDELVEAWQRERSDLDLAPVEVFSRVQDHVIAAGRAHVEREVLEAFVSKTSLMVGCGEAEAEVLDAMAKLREADVDVLTIGQYLRPTPKHAEVKRFVEPAEFERFREAGVAMGFRYVASGPLVRSSYRAAEAFLQGILQGVPHAPYEDRYGKKTRLAVLP